MGEIPQKPLAFQDRRDLLSTITDSPEGERVSVVFAVTGLRGAGKSQLAAACARQRLEDGWRVVAWINAEDREQMLAGYGDLAVALDLAAGVPGTARAASNVRHWLEADGSRCLIVLDNAVSADAVRPFLPTAGRAQVIVTSSKASLAALGAPVPIGVFTHAEAAKFLAERTGLDDLAGAQDIAEELGYLPLALAQAGAVIAGQHLGYRTYLRRLAEVALARSLIRPEEDPYPRGTAQAIVMTLDAARKDDPNKLGRRLIRIIALLSPAGISRLLLTDATRADAAAVDAALERLAAWSLISWSEDGSVVQAHRLVMRVVRERTCAERAVLRAYWEAFRGLEDQILRSWVEPQYNIWTHSAMMPEYVKQLSALRVHLNVDALRSPLRQFVDSMLVSLESRAGEHFAKITDTSRAIPLLEQSVAHWQQRRGLDHPRTLKALNLLATAYQEAGRFDEANTLHQQILAERQRRSPNRQETLEARCNLGIAYQKAGRLNEAISLFEQTFHDRERRYGPSWFETLASRRYLAAAYQDAGRSGEAIDLYEQAPAEARRRWTWDSELAAAYQAAGRLSEAIDLYEQALAKAEDTLGSDNFVTGTARRNLAVAYQKAGRLEEAISLLEQVLSARRAVLGSDHPYTLTARADLAAAYQQAGRLDEAISLREQVLADRRRVLGPDHPNTLAAFGHLAATYQRAGRMHEAISQLGRYAEADPASLEAIRLTPSDDADRQALGQILRALNKAADPDLTEIEIIGIRTVQRSGEPERRPEDHPEDPSAEWSEDQPILLLKEKAGDSYLPIPIGPVEAMAIAFVQQGMVPLRPLTHDLMRDILEAAGVWLLRVTFVAVRDEVYYAELSLSDGSAVSARPSDATALALRMGAPLYARREVIDAVGVEVPGEPAAQQEVSEQAASTAAAAPAMMTRLGPTATTIELELLGVRVEAQNDQPVVLLREKFGNRYLPIWSGAAEATSIVYAQQKMVTLQPLTHDLMRDILNAVNVQMMSATIVALRDGIFYADLNFSTGSTVSSRPSDAVSLAIRTGASIFVTEQILDEAGVALPDEEEPAAMDPDDAERHSDGDR